MALGMILSVVATAAASLTLLPAAIKERRDATGDARLAVLLDATAIRVDVGSHVQPVTSR